jgi:hypothetical protein
MMMKMMILNNMVQNNTMMKKTTMMMIKWVCPQEHIFKEVKWGQWLATTNL